MKLEIYKEEEQEEDKIRLRLVNNYKGILLQVVDEDGFDEVDGTILRINKNGTLKIASDMNKDIKGLKLDSRGRIKIRKEK